MNQLPRLLPVVLLCLACAGFLRAQSAPAALPPAGSTPAIYLTWQRDPAHTMTVHWHSVWTEGYRDTVLEYRAASAGANAPWILVSGSSRPMPFTERMVHTAEIESLQPDTLYVFRLGRLHTQQDGSFAFVPDGPSHRFRTLPARLSRPVRFLSGGDAHGNQTFDKINRVAASYDPDFALIGGDIAYSDGRPARADRWFDFFRVWTETMVTKDGRLIPMIPAIGNHEAHGDTYELGGGSPARGLRTERAAYFYSLFSFPGLPGYNVLDAGDYLSIVALDTAHTNPVAGPQTEWLKGVLAARRNVNHVIPLYHVPAYPSHRAFTGATSVAVRTHWVPLFDEAGIRLALENHDHAYKVTHPLRGGERHPHGTRYLGDGAWAVGPRATHPLAEAPYLERAETRNHVFVITLHPDRAEVLAVDPAGEEFGHLKIPVRP